MRIGEEGVEVAIKLNIANLHTLFSLIAMRLYRVGRFRCRGFQRFGRGNRQVSGVKYYPRKNVGVWRFHSRPVGLELECSLSRNNLCPCNENDRTDKP